MLDLQKDKSETNNQNKEGKKKQQYLERLFLCQHMSWSIDRDTSRAASVEHTRISKYASLKMAEWTGPQVSNF